MTVLVYTYAALPPLPDGRNPVHLYISREEPTNTDFARNERKAAEDAERLIGDIVLENDPQPNESLLQSGPIPEKAIPIFMFAIGVSWDAKSRMAHYSKVDYRRLLTSSRWNPVAEVAMDQYDYTMSVVRRRENAERRDKGVGRFRVDRETEEAARRVFSDIAGNVMAVQFRRMGKTLLMEKRAKCTRRVGGQCSPADFACEFYCDGRCGEEPKC